MGMEKKAHIRALLSCPSGDRQWKERCGKSWTEEDVERLYEKFEGILYQMVAEYSVPIPGVVETVRQLREKGLKIGSTHRLHIPDDGTRCCPGQRSWGMRPTAW